MEVFCEESIWVEIKINNQQCLLGTFYSPKSQDQHFLDAFDRNIELALENSEHIIVVGDLNEDLRFELPKPTRSSSDELIAKYY